MLLGEEKWGCNNFKWSNLYLPKFLVVLHLTSNFLNKERGNICVKYPLIFQKRVQIMGGC